jgi:hypothetical protein
MIEPGDRSRTWNAFEESNSYRLYFKLKESQEFSQPSWWENILSLLQVETQPLSLEKCMFALSVKRVDFFRKTIKREKIQQRFFNIKEIRHIGLDLGLGENTDERLCSLIKAMMPSVNWQRKQIEWFSNLTKTEKNALFRYTDWRFERMDRELQDKEEDNIPLNEIIQKAPPLEQDIVVFLPIREEDDIVDRGEFTIKRYIATSFNLLTVRHFYCENMSYHVSLMRIKVRKGTRCLFYNPNSECKLIFPRNTRLFVHSKRQVSFSCKKSETVVRDVYDGEIVG